MELGGGVRSIYFGTLNKNSSLFCDKKNRHEKKTAGVKVLRGIISETISIVTIIGRVRGRMDVTLIRSRGDRLPENQENLVMKDPNNKRK